MKRLKHSQKEVSQKKLATSAHGTSKNDKSNRKKQLETSNSLLPPLDNRKNQFDKKIKGDLIQEDSPKNASSRPTSSSAKRDFEHSREVLDNITQEESGRQQLIQSEKAEFDLLSDELKSESFSVYKKAYQEIHSDLQGIKQSYAEKEVSTRRAIATLASLVKSLVCDEKVIELKNHSDEISFQNKMIPLPMVEKNVSFNNSLSSDLALVNNLHRALDHSFLTTSDNLSEKNSVFSEKKIFPYESEPNSSMKDELFSFDEDSFEKDVALAKEAILNIKQKMALYTEMVSLMETEKYRKYQSSNHDNLIRSYVHTKEENHLPMLCIDVALSDTCDIGIRTLNKMEEIDQVVSDSLNSLIQSFKSIQSARMTNISEHEAYVTTNYFHEAMEHFRSSMNQNYLDQMLAFKELQRHFLSLSEKRNEELLRWKAVFSESIPADFTEKIKDLDYENLIRLLYFLSKNFQCGDLVFVTIGRYIESMGKVGSSHNEKVVSPRNLEPKSECENSARKIKNDQAALPSNSNHSFDNSDYSEALREHKGVKPTLILKARVANPLNFPPRSYDHLHSLLIKSRVGYKDYQSKLRSSSEVEFPPKDQMNVFRVRSLNSDRSFFLFKHFFQFQCQRLCRSNSESSYFLRSLQSDNLRGTLDASFKGNIPEGENEESLLATFSDCQSKSNDEENLAKLNLLMTTSSIGASCHTSNHSSNPPKNKRDMKCEHLSGKYSITSMRNGLAIDFVAPPM